MRREFICFFARGYLDWCSNIILKLQGNRRETRLLGILSFVHSTVWKVLFGKVSSFIKICFYALSPLIYHMLDRKVIWLCYMKLLCLCYTVAQSQWHEISLLKDMTFDRFTSRCSMLI